jgi:hypothetical protein
LPEGFYAYVFVTKAKGYWRDLGLDVDVARGYGSLPAAQAIAEGQYQFGTSNASAVVQLAGKGVQLASLGIMDYNPSMGLAVLGDSPIRHPKDLEGKRVAQTLASSDAAFFAPFCEKNGVDIKKVELLNMDPRVRNQALGDGRVDAITGFASSLLAALASTGKKVRFLLYGDYGIFLYGDIALLEIFADQSRGLRGIVSRRGAGVEARGFGARVRALRHGGAALQCAVGAGCQGARSWLGGYGEAGRHGGFDVAVPR